VSVPFPEQLRRFRADSAEVLRELRRHKFHVGPAEARRMKSRRAQERARRTARPRPPVLVLRPVIHKEETSWQ